jgi:branched-chain amino acid transport system permease protein
MDMDLLVQAMVQGLLIGATYGFVALGLGIIYSVSGVVNFSHGDFVTAGMFLCYSLWAAFALDPYVSVAITVPLFAVIGALLYRLLIRPIVGAHLLMIVQLTLGLSFIIQNGLLITFGGQPLRTPSAYEAKLIFVGDSLVMRFSLIVAFVVSVTFAGLLYWVLQSTDLGRSVRAVHQNAKAAALMGIDVTLIRTITFAAGFAMLAIAAALLLPGTPAYPGMGFRYTVITLMVIILGGMTNFMGILLSGFAIGISEAIGTVYVSGVVGMMLPYFIFIVVLLFRPQGLLGGAKS